MERPEEELRVSGRPDLFYRGVITRLFPRNNMGLVRTESGREIPFSFNLVVLLGEVKSAAELREGLPVGYDIGWTPSGLRVTKIKTYPAQASDRTDPSLQGKGSQGQDLPS